MLKDTKKMCGSHRCTSRGYVGVGGWGGRGGYIMRWGGRKRFSHAERRGGGVHIKL